MDISDFGWERQPQEHETGDYWFNGQMYVTRTIKESLSPIEIACIFADVKNLVEIKKGVDYLFVYIHKETQEKLFFIDQVTRKSLKNGDHPPEHNYCTLMYAHEY